MKPETYWFTFDDMPAPPALGYSSIGGRLILQINGRFSSSIYETVCYMADGDSAREAADRLNRSPDIDLIVDILDRAKRLGRHDALVTRDEG